MIISQGPTVFTHAVAVSNTNTSESHPTEGLWFSSIILTLASTKLIDYPMNEETNRASEQGEKAVVHIQFDPIFLTSVTHGNLDGSRGPGRLAADPGTIASQLTRTPHSNLTLTASLTASLTTMAPPARLVRWLAASLAITPSLALTPVHIALQHARSLQAASERITSYVVQRPAYNLSVPIDHFHNDSLYEPHSDGFFDLRYWVDESHYRPGGPVIVLAAGEIDADERLPYLDHGIVAMLARATGGVGVVLEHRYYGTSFPFQNVTVDNLRFLSTDQALADTAYFAKHVKFPRHGGLNAPDTPYIIYGGSYAGAFAAFARKLYPEVFWGAISSSGVTAAVFDYWEYFEAARLFAPGECGPRHQNIFKIIDNVLLGGDREKVHALKNVFGLGDLKEDKDFAETLSTPIYGLQSTNWDPELDDYEWGHYCGAITSGALLYGSTRHLLPTVKKLVAEAGFDDDDEVVYNLLNFIGFSKGTIARTLKGPCKGLSAQKCFSREEQLNDIAQHGLIPTWVISWFYQTCTQYVPTTPFSTAKLTRSDGATSSQAPASPKTSSPSSRASSTSPTRTPTAPFSSTSPPRPPSSTASTGSAASTSATRAWLLSTARATPGARRPRTAWVSPSGTRPWRSLLYCWTTVCIIGMRMVCQGNPVSRICRRSRLWKRSARRWTLSKRGCRSLRWRDDRDRLMTDPAICERVIDVCMNASCTNMKLYDQEQ